MVQVQVCASFFWYKVSLWLSQEETRGSSFASNEQLLRIWMEASFIEASNWGFGFLLALALSHSSLFLLGFMVLLHYYYISFLGAFFLSTFQSHATCMQQLLKQLCILFYLCKISGLFIPINKAYYILFTSIFSFLSQVLILISSNGRVQYFICIIGSHLRIQIQTVTTIYTTALILK